MGQPKLALPWPPDPTAPVEPSPDTARPTVASHVFDALAPWCDRMVVVLGNDADLVKFALSDRPFIEVLGDPEAPMFDSICRALRQVQTLDPPAESVLLSPADHVGVSAAPIERLVAALVAAPGCAAIPESDGRGGHPVLIPSSLFQRILAWPGLEEGRLGLGGFWRDHPEFVKRVPGSPQECRRDIDTAADYLRG